MLGGMLAGHDQSGGETIKKVKVAELIAKTNYFISKLQDGKEFRQFYGMASKTAQEKHHGGLQEYRASEGKAVLIPYRGDVEPTTLDILGGLRSACTYVGAAELKELSRRATFIRVTQQTNEIFRGAEAD